MNYRTAAGRVYAAIGEPRTLSGNTYICLDVTLPNRPKSVLWVNRKLLTACELEKPVQLTREMKQSVNHAIGVQIEIVKPCTALVVWKPAQEWRLSVKPARIDYLYHEALRAVA